MPTLEALVTTWAPELKGKRSLWFGSDISDRKRRHAIEAYAPSVAPDRVLALHDATIMGSASEGFLVTRAGFYFKGSGEPKGFAFVAIEDVASYPEVNDKGEVTGKDGLCVRLTSGEVRFGSGELNTKALGELLTGMLAARAEGQVDEVDGFVIVEAMRDEVKLAYLQIIIQMTWDDDQRIDQRELAELQTLMTQLNFSPALRHEARAYIASPDQTLEALLATMDHRIPRGSEEALHISLVKDLIRVLRATRPGANPVASATLKTVASHYAIGPDTIALLQDACAFDEDILAGKLDDSQIVARAKDLAAKASAVGVPIAAIYLSGSVMGLSAAGITSGLAALGLGGLLGLSSMVTGIGVVVLIGVAVYVGMRWLTGGRAREKMARREMMLQDVLHLNQQTVTHLIEDINYYARRMVDLTRETEINRQMVDKLAREMSIFSDALGVLQAKGVDVEKILLGDDAPKPQQA